MITDEDCQFAVELPFIKGTSPEDRSRCEQIEQDRQKQLEQAPVEQEEVKNPE